MSSINYHRIAVNQEDTNAQNYTSLDNLVSDKNPNDISSNILVDLYQNVPVGNTSFKHLMRLFKYPAENLPIVHHCTGGRDRTGIGAMLILLVLDVEWEKIVEDYTYSNVALQDYHAKIFSQLEDILPKQQAEKFKNDFLLKEDYLTLSYNNILNSYRTIETFLYEEYGITEDIRKEIQNYCLE